ncbi:competence protein CoiA [Planococcus sp. CP5-4]|uniref:competence protein CoiA n=1 Tax=unclassified Planococcus (in: firmicutes) TaxID=2662419 RepID=UPI001C22FCFB|nr:competence protein CoiA family protein [Planococcus sp. CP5-4]MBU9673754.1 competence protein CoiA [Planococcus sp. CP5-4_YE]MBV0907830.1 competence protein CoiA [Planococcus sp. CP5-4_UN]MBW6062997.1 competence protein CoiA [Planococcus sp. CP5-4]
MIYILTALDKGRLFTLQAYHTRQELIQLRRERTFLCPACEAPVVLKVGTTKIPHFAHLQQFSCTPGSEPETPLHLLGKSRLASFFHDQKIPAYVEHYLPQIKQRPDLLAKKSAIEIQCSTLPLEQVVKRSQGYAKIGLHAIWIRGIKSVPAPGLGLVQVRPFERAMFRGQPLHPHLLQFNPHHSLFVYYSNLFYVQGNRWIGKVSLLSLKEQVFPFAVPKKLTKAEHVQAVSLMRIENNKYIRSQLFAKNRMRNPFWRLSYELRLDKEAIPEIFGLPLAGGHLFVEHPLIWQMKAALMIESGKPVETLLTERLVKIAPSGIDMPTPLQVLSAYETIYRNGYSRSFSEVVDIAYHLLAKTWEN